MVSLMRIKNAADDVALRRLIVRAGVARVDLDILRRKAIRHVVGAASDDAEGAFHPNEFTAIAGTGIGIPGHLQQLGILSDGQTLPVVRVLARLSEDWCAKAGGGDDKQGFQLGIHVGSPANENNRASVAQSAQEYEFDQRQPILLDESLYGGRPDSVGALVP